MSHIKNRQIICTLLLSCVHTCQAKEEINAVLNYPGRSQLLLRYAEETQIGKGRYPEKIYVIQELYGYRYYKAKRLTKAMIEINEKTSGSISLR